MASVTIDQVTKTYAGGGPSAVSDVSIGIEDGEFIVLVGPSGCGKSTLLRMIAGLETITSGEIRIGDRRVNDVDPAERDIAMVFQNYALYPHMTVRRNMAYGLQNRRMDRAEIDRRVAEAAQILQLGEYLDRKPRQLSGGQRQRVAMGRAIVREPACFLFDEPLSNLDAKLRVEMRGEIKQLQRRLGTTSVYVTHDQLEAMTLADRLVVLNKGKIEQMGRPLEVYRDPVSTFVASFIGSPPMNLLSGESDGREVRVGPAILPLNGHAVPSGPLTVGMRAESFSTPGAGIPLQMPISYVEELGAERLVHAELAGQRLTVLMGTEHDLGDTLNVGIDPARLHFFGPDGRALRPGADTLTK